MQVTEQSAASKAEQVARSRPAVERWLTWSGLVPLPVFLLLHLSTELYRSFASDVGDLVRAAPTAFELVTLALLVWAPLGVHAALGVWLLTREYLVSPTVRIVGYPFGVGGYEFIGGRWLGGLVSPFVLLAFIADIAAGVGICLLPLRVAQFIFERRFTHDSTPWRA